MEFQEVCTFGISLRHLIIWVVSSFIFPIYTLGFTLNWVQISSFDAMMLALNLSASTLFFASPIVIGSVLLFTTSEARKSILASSKSRESYVKVILTRLLVIVVFCTLIMSILLCIGYLVYAPMAVEPMNPGFIVGFALSSLIIALFVSPLAITIILLLDDWKHATLGGTCLFLSLSLLGSSGTSTNIVFELSLFSPAHIYRAIAVTMSGVSNPTPSSMVYYFGVFFTPIDLVIPIILYAISSIVFLKISSIFLAHSVLRWPHKEDLWEKVDYKKEDRTGMIRSIKSEAVALRKRSRYATLILVALAFILPVVGTSYAAYKQTSSYEIIYETPPGGITLNLGDWIYAEIYAEQPPPGVNRMYNEEIHIHNWNYDDDFLWLSSSIRHITLDQFLAMNDTERWEAGFAGGHGLYHDQPDDVGGWHGLSGEWGVQVWAMRLLDENWNVTSGSLTFSLTVRIGDRV